MKRKRKRMRERKRERKMERKSEVDEIKILLVVVSSFLLYILYITYLYFRPVQIVLTGVKWAAYRHTNLLFTEFKTRLKNKAQQANDGSLHWVY